MKARDPETAELVELDESTFPLELPLRWSRARDGHLEEMQSMVSPGDEGWETALDDWVKAELGLVPEPSD